MSRPPRYLWLALAGLALGGLAPSAARAGCGSYVHIGGARHDAVPAGAQAKSDAAAQHPLPAPSHPKPCSGPGCSQGRQPLLPLPTTPPSPEGERWGDNPFMTSQAEQLTAFLPLPLSAARPVRPLSSVYHPPR